MNVPRTHVLEDEIGVGPLRWAGPEIHHHRLAAQFASLHGFVYRRPWRVYVVPRLVRPVVRRLDAHAQVMVDFWPRPPERSYPDLILKHMRPGDIHTHVLAWASESPLLTASVAVLCARSSRMPSMV